MSSRKLVVVIVSEESLTKCDVLRARTVVGKLKTAISSLIHTGPDVGMVSRASQFELCNLELLRKGFLIVFRVLASGLLNSVGPWR